MIIKLAVLVDRSATLSFATICQVDTNSTLETTQISSFFLLIASGTIPPPFPSESGKILMKVSGVLTTGKTSLLPILSFAVGRTIS